MNGKQNVVVLSFGGNQVNSLDCFEKAKHKISKKIGTTTANSHLYQTKAWGMKPGTTDFFNQVIIIVTKLKPKKLLKKTQKLEKKLGRKNKRISTEYEDRPIDIDILFFNDEIIQKPNLIIPHYLIQNRKFILDPLCELIPDYVHPSLNKTIKELLLLCQDKLEVKRIKKQTNAE